MASTDAEKTLRESFAMQRERVAAAVERQRELDEQYNPNHHLLNACTMDDLALVQYLVQEEKCDLEYVLPEQRRELQQKMTKMGLVMIRLLKPGDTPLKVSERFESAQVLEYLRSNLSHHKKKKSKSSSSKSEKSSSLMDSIMGSFFKPSSSQKKVQVPDVNLSGSIHVNKSEVNLIEVIGSGLYCTVWRGQCRGTMVAVKIPKEISQDTLQLAPELIQEMSALRSPDVSSLIGVCLEEENLMLITELMSGNLRKLLQSRTYLSLPLRLRMALDCSTGMQYLHSSNIVHGDLKSSNVLYEELGSDYAIRVSDSGLARLFSSKGNAKAVGTPFYTAPEVLLGGDPSKESDVYSFGILLYEFVSRKLPFSNYENYEVFKKALTTQAVRPTLPKDCPPEVATLIERCWDQNPNKRPNFVDIRMKLWDLVIQLSIPDSGGIHFWTKFITDKEKDIFRDSISWDDFAITFCSFLDEKATPLPAEVTEDEIPNASVGQMYELCARGPAMRQVISKVLQGKSFKSFGMWAKDAVTKHTNKSIHWRCFRELLIRGGKQVHIEQFGEICGAFGPCEVVVGGDTVKGSFLSRIKEAMETGFFFGPISVKASLNLLKGKDPGSFLIRLTKEGDFCISRINRSKEVLHYKAFRDKNANMYRLDQDPSGQSYASLAELVEGTRMKLRLFTPCSAPKFIHLFVDEQEDPVNYMMADY
eukprot:CAMPEP_0201481142 /NCGR_PEP_ID=MMETSP0151_2-20130828/5464_1 /ASSEMBLY_ACC=CAM_ASM_000257 /TAXON_ID=200890 /ORGANISM="Paramoeba atlantica, Strain 621/1 / CCAP 1560/9" /LENGTH=702 /DNA_ID=CAMNT_0047863209 /DNA_START=533 /DNA_END=2641 /DNA_ORIENTATION=+